MADNIGVFQGLVDAVLVISMPGHERRIETRRHFSDLGVDFDFVDAFDGYNMPIKDLIEHDIVAPVDEFWEKPFLPGEVGCYFSHVLTYLHALRRGYEKVLICEDDVEFLYVNEFLRTSLEAAPSNADLLYLFSAARPGSGHPIDFGRAFHNEYWRKANHEGRGATAYIVNTRCLKYLIENAFPMRFALDGLTKWPSSDWCKEDFRCYIADPLLCGTRNCPSTIRTPRR